MDCSSEIFYAKDQQDKLNKCIIFHIILLIFKNVMGLYLSSVRYLKKFTLLRYVSVRNMLSIMIVNLISFLGYTWALLNVDLTSYEQMTSSMLSFLAYGLCMGLQCIKVFYDASESIDECLIGLLLFIAFLEYLAVWKVSKILGPLSLQSITRRTSDVKVIYAFNKRTRLRTMRVGLMGFAIVSMTNSIILNLFQFALKRLCPGAQVGHRNTIWGDLADFLIFFLLVKLTLLLTLRLDEENRTQRKLAMVTAVVLICLGIFSFVSQLSVHEFKCMDFDILQPFLIMFSICVLVTLIEEYKLLGADLQKYIQTTKFISKTKKKL